MFSELVDDIAKVARRQVDIPYITQQVENTIREMQEMHLFDKDFVEDQWVVTSVPFSVNRPRGLRRIQTLNYNKLIWPKFIRPSRRIIDETHYYYASTTYLVFNGVNVGDTINIGYYQWIFPKLYYANGARPAVYDRVADTWSYLQGSSYVSTLGSVSLDEAAQSKVIDWILKDHRGVVLEGALAKSLLKVDDTRAKGAFALYKELQIGFLNSEVNTSRDA